MKFYFLLGLCLHLLWCSRVYSYAFLSEYLNAEGTVLRAPEAIGKASDIIKAPRWNEKINIVLCIGGNAIQKALINPGEDFENWTDELVIAANEAVSNWKNAGSGTSLEVNPVIKSEDCGPDLGDAYGGKEDGQNRIFFNNSFEDGSAIPKGVIAFTLMSLKAENGNLRIVDADIIFNVDESFDFQGVLTHELGHLFGIAHSPITDDNDSDEINTAASMFPAISNDGSSLSSLTLDDELAIQNLYPAENELEGRISGYVYRADGKPQRAAHISVFSVENKQSLAGTFTSISGTRANADGSYSIQGLPLNHDFIVFVEPAHRPDVHPNFLYWVFNTPIHQALQFQTEGYRHFAIEAFPDVEIVDIRKTRNINSPPGIEGAKVMRLTSSQKEIKNINFYLSDLFTAPNDALYTDLQINRESQNELIINNDNPIQLYIEIPTDLSIFQEPKLQLKAEFNAQTLDWTDSIPTFEWKKKGVRLSTSLPSPRPVNGTYTLMLSLEDPKYGSFSISREAKIMDWTQSQASVEYRDDISGEKLDESDQISADEADGNSGGGGCSLKSDNPDSYGLACFLMSLLIAGLIRRSRLLR